MDDGERQACGLTVMTESVDRDEVASCNVSVTMYERGASGVLERSIRSTGLSA